MFGADLGKSASATYSGGGKFSPHTRQRAICCPGAGPSGGRGVVGSWGRGETVSMTREGGGRREAFGVGPGLCRFPLVGGAKP